MDPTTTGGTKTTSTGTTRTAQVPKGTPPPTPHPPRSRTRPRGSTLSHSTCEERYSPRALPTRSQRWPYFLPPSPHGASRPLWPYRSLEGARTAYSGSPTNSAPKATRPRSSRGRRPTPESMGTATGAFCSRGSERTSTLTRRRQRGHGAEGTPSYAPPMSRTTRKQPSSAPPRPGDLTLSWVGEPWRCNSRDGQGPTPPRRSSPR